MHPVPLFTPAGFTIVYGMQRKDGRNPNGSEKKNHYRSQLSLPITCRTLSSINTMDKPQRSSSFDTLIPRSSIEAEYHDKAVFFKQAASKQQRRLQCGLLVLLGLSLVANIGLSIVVYDAIFETLNLIRTGDTICKPHTKLYCLFNRKRLFDGSWLIA